MNFKKIYSCDVSSKFSGIFCSFILLLWGSFWIKVCHTSEVTWSPEAVQQSGSMTLRSSETLNSSRMIGRHICKILMPVFWFFVYFFHVENLRLGDLFVKQTSSVIVHLFWPIYMLTPWMFHRERLILLGGCSDHCNLTPPPWMSPESGAKMIWLLNYF